MGKQRYVFAVLIWALLLITGCRKFSWHPYEVRVDDELTNLTAKNLNRLDEKKILADDIITIAIIADTQYAIDEMQEAIDDINQRREIDMVFHAGDITDVGTTKEYVWTAEILEELKVPYFAVIGNHDCLGGGKELYREVYGPMNFSFTIDGHQFIFFNTNTLEFVNDDRFDVPDFNWLKEQLKDSVINNDAYIMAHIAPYNFEFGDENANKYHDLIDDGYVQLSLHGHSHEYFNGELFSEGVEYLATDNMRDRNYTLLKIQGGRHSHERIFY